MLIRKIIICFVASSMLLLSAYSLNQEGLYHKEAVKLPAFPGAGKSFKGTAFALFKKLSARRACFLKWANRTEKLNITVE